MLTRRSLALLLCLALAGAAPAPSMAASSPSSSSPAAAGAVRGAIAIAAPRATRLALLLFALLAAAPGLARAQMTGAACGRIPYCNTCIARRIGSVTRLLCTNCNTGYAPSADQRTCFCAPGFWWDDVEARCNACGVGAWCPGGTSNSKGQRIACGTNMTTTTTRSRYSEQCRE